MLLFFRRMGISSFQATKRSIKKKRKHIVVPVFYIVKQKDFYDEKKSQYSNLQNSLCIFKEFNPFTVSKVIDYFLPR